MQPYRRAFVAVALLLASNGLALAQKRGGVLMMYSVDSPSSMSIHEEATVYAQGPVMGVFNNLIMFDQNVKQNSLKSIVPDLATAWVWNENGTALTFTLRQGVTWHDGKPFTAADVKCTWDLLIETSSDKLRVNPRRLAYINLERVSINGDFAVTFHLKQAQPAFPMLLASGNSPVYPCHVPAREMRTHPIGTGPFKFAWFRANESIRVTRNENYWKKDRPFLDGIEYTIIRDQATANLAFIAGKFDMTFPFLLTPQMRNNIMSQSPTAICETAPVGGINRLLIINRDNPPFDNPELRRAMALSLDRQAFIDIVAEGDGEIGGVLQPPPGGLWGMNQEQMKDLPGYGPDVKQNREQARAIMRKLGYGPDNRLKIKVFTRDLSYFKPSAILLIDQLREVWFDAELDSVETTAFTPRFNRKDFAVGLYGQGSGPDPDPTLALLYGCGSIQNPDGYCSANMDTLIAQKSAEADPERRRHMVWAIERRLAEENARPILFYSNGGTCWKPDVKGVTIMSNSIFNGNRREDIWLDR